MEFLDQQVGTRLRLLIIISKMPSRKDIPSLTLSSSVNKSAHFLTVSPAMGVLILYSVSQYNWQEKVGGCNLDLVLGHFR